MARRGLDLVVWRSGLGLVTRRDQDLVVRMRGQDLVRTRTEGEWWSSGRISLGWAGSILRM